MASMLQASEESAGQKGGGGVGGGWPSVQANEGHGVSSGGGTGPSTGGRYASEGRYASARSSVTASAVSVSGQFGVGRRYDDDEGGSTVAESRGDGLLAEEDSVASGRVGGGGTFFTALLRWASLSPELS